MGCTVRHVLFATLVSVMLAWPAIGQTPQPFPRPGQAPPPKQPAPQTPPPQTPPPQTPGPKQPATASTPPASDRSVPTAATLVFPVYPTAQFIASYDAGRGQRYYLFGTTAQYADIVSYYRTQLDERGTQVFKEPPTHMFEVGRFREEAMAFPPGVTVKDWTWGSKGYPNPKLNSQPERFPTIIMIVPPPPGSQN
jgi:hypothetical protein